MRKSILIFTILFVFAFYSENLLVQTIIKENKIDKLDRYRDLKIISQDSLNGWKFIGSEFLDTFYTKLSDTASEGNSSQLFGWSTTDNFSAARWEKSLLTDYIYPDSIKIDVRCIKMNPSENRTISIDVGFLNGDTLPCQWGWGTPNYSWRTYTIYKNQCSPNIFAINKLLLTFQFIPNLGDTSSAHGGEGEYLVDNLRFFYYNKVILVDGFGDPATGIEDRESIPNQFFLEQNYPNPFNPSTTIQYSIPQQSFITIKVYDLLGRDVATLINEEKPSGNYEVEFNGTSLTSGVYFYQLRTKEYVETKKMVLLR